MSNIVTQRFVKCHNKLREDNKIRSSRQFALTLDYLPQSLSEILKGRRDVTIELLRKAVETYKLNPVYIYTGEGPMFMTDDDYKSFRVLTIVTDSGNDERIVHVPGPAQTGYANEILDPLFVQDLPTFNLPDYKYHVGTHRSFDVTGDSMEPTLMEGDKVVCSYLEPKLWSTSIKDNYVYVLVTRGDVLIKRVNNKIKAEKQLELISDNIYYSPFQVGVSELREVWYVRAKISPFLPSPRNLTIVLREEIQKLQKIVNDQTKAIEAINDSLKTLTHQNNHSQ